MRFSLLVTIGLLIGGYILLRHILQYTATSLTVDSYFWRLKWLFVVCLLLLLVVRIIPWQKNTTGGSAAETMLMLDVSKSMLVQDWSDGLSRLDTAKQLISTLIAKSTPHKRGLGIFAGETQGILPLTADTDLLLTFLAWLDHRNLTKQGTNLTEAVTYASQRFSSGDNQKTIVILSDGGDESIDLSKQVIERFEDQHITTIVVGIGSVEGWPIPEGVDAFGEVVYKQWQGETVISQLEEKSLKELAKTIDWTYLSADRFARSNLSLGANGGKQVKFVHSWADLLLRIITLLLLAVIRLHLKQQTKRVDEQRIRIKKWYFHYFIKNK